MKLYRCVRQPAYLNIQINLNIFVTRLLRKIPYPEILMLPKREYLKVLWYIDEKISCSLHVVVLCFHQTVKRQWGRAAAYNGEYTLTSELSTTWGRDHQLSMCQRSLYTYIYERSILQNACGINTGTSRVQSDLESNWGTYYKLWERTTT